MRQSLTLLLRTMIYLDLAFHRVRNDMISQPLVDRWISHFLLIKKKSFTPSPVQEKKDVALILTMVIEGGEREGGKSHFTAVKRLTLGRARFRSQSPSIFSFRKKCCGFTSSRDNSSERTKALTCVSFSSFSISQSALHDRPPAQQQHTHTHGVS